jgi:hypothetical protein
VSVALFLGLNLLLLSPIAAIHALAESSQPLLMRHSNVATCPLNLQSIV